MGLGWAGFLSGMGQGLERASGSVDQYLASKRLAQSLAMQQAQQKHMLEQDALAQRNYLERVASDKDKDTRADDLQKRQIINEDLMNMNSDQMPLGDMPPEWQASARRFAPTQIVQPKSTSTVGFAQGLPSGQASSLGPASQEDQTGMAPGSSISTPNAFGGEQVNRFVSPAERNNMRTMQQQLTKAQMENLVKQAQIDMNYGTRGDRTTALYYEADQRRIAAEAAAKARADAAEVQRKARAGQFGFSQANTGYDRWLKDEWGPANPLTLQDIQKNPLSTNKYRPPTADQITQKKLELFEKAIGAAGFSPSDFPDILNKMGVPMGAPSDGGPLANQANQAPPPPQMAPPPMMASHAPPPAMMTAHAQPGPPLPAPPAPWASRFPDPKAAPPAPKAVTINELKGLVPTLKAAGVKVETDADLLNYARSNGYTVTP